MPEYVRQLKFADVAAVTVLSTDAKKKVHPVRFELEGPMFALFYLFPQNGC